jgi:hypothetical protein
MKAMQTLMSYLDCGDVLPPVAFIEVSDSPGAIYVD